MSEKNPGDRQSGYGHPEADWTDEGGPSERREGESRREGRDEEEDEPPDPGGSSAEELPPTWSQRQARYPAPERPRDQAETTEEAAAAAEPPEEPEPVRLEAAEVDAQPHAADATTADEGGGTDAELREASDKRGVQPLRKSPARERKRAG